MAFAKKVSDAQADEMLTRYQAGDSIGSIARKMNFCTKTVRQHVVVSDKHGFKVKCEGKALSYRDNLAWAMASAGTYLRTKKHPITCPNDSAWFLYTQAVDEPKDFMAKVGQVESKNDSGELDAERRKGSKKTLSEIENFLEELSEQNEKTTDCEGSEKNKVEGTRNSDEVRPLQEAAG